MAAYDINGNRVDYNGAPIEARMDEMEAESIITKDYDANVKSVNHRGYSAVAPENTLPAYKLSKKMGFNYAETDVSFTKDGVAVCLHDATIDRTSNGSGNINDLTLEQVRSYDFGSWKDAKYAGTTIPTLEEFLLLCKRIMLHPYIELKNTEAYTEAQIRSIVDMVRACGMKGKVTYISFSATFLGYVKDYDSEARLGYLVNRAVTSDIAVIQAMRTGSNEVFYSVSYYSNTITDANCAEFAAADIPIETWTIDSADIMLGLNKYVSGITSNNLIAGKVLYDADMA